MATKKPAWADETIYSRSDATRTPSTWVLRTKTLKICVTRRHLLSGWWLHADEAGLRDFKLLAADIEDAKTEALALVRLRLQLMLKGLEGVGA